MSLRYGIDDLAEAEAYLADPMLGDRLRECVAAVLKHAGSSTAHQVFGSPDDLKFRSCLTLFEAAAPTEALFRKALDAFYLGERDPRTIELSTASGVSTTFRSLRLKLKSLS